MRLWPLLIVAWLAVALGSCGMEFTAGGGEREADCLNGTDDDGDGQIDCEDPDCSNYVCVPAYPAPVSYAFRGDGATSCPTPSSPIELGGCDCACQVHSGSCHTQLEIFIGPECANYHTSKIEDDCYYISAPQDRSYQGTTTPFGNGSCELDGDCDLTSWHGCVLDAPGQCADEDQVCVPKSAGATGCVLIPGLATCSEPYAKTSHLIDLASAGGACGCVKTDEQCMNGTVTVYRETQGCDRGETTVLPMDGECHHGGPTLSYHLESGPSGVQCTPQVVAGDSETAYTLCCVP